MQKPVLKLLFAVLLGGIFGFSVPICVANQTTYTLNFPESDMSFEKLEGFDRVTLEGCNLFILPGEPTLPVKYVQIAIPPDAEVVSVQVNSVDRKLISGSYSIFPGQKLRPLSDIPWAGKDYRFTPPNSDVYGLSSEFPGKMAEVLSQGFLGGRHIAGLAFYPLQYLPSEKELILYTRIEFTLVFEPAKIQPLSVSTRTERQVEFFREMAQNSVINPEDVKIETSGGAKQGTVEYLIITDTNFVSTFKQLADWKTKKGVPAEIVTIQWLYSHYSGYDNPEQIRNCIKDFRQNRGTIWVLLGGDTNVLPHRITWIFTSGVGGFPDEDYIPSDHYFSDLDRNWDGDGDHTYGEFGDNVDLYPDVIVGRAPVSNASQAQAFVNKTLAYETNPPADYQTKMLLAAEYLWEPTDGGVLKNYIYDTYVTPLFPNVTKLYESLGNLNKTSFRNALNSGQMITNHCGHGNVSVLSIGPSAWYNSDMDALTNGTRQGIFYTYACISAAIDYDCIGEHFVKNASGGGIAYFGNTRYGWGDYDPLQGPGSEFDKEFFRRLFDLYSYHAGKTLADSKILFIPSAQNSSGDGPYNRWTLFELLLLGDPEMQIYTDTPPALTVTYPDTIGVGSQNINVYVEKGGSPVSGALVCLSKVGEVYVYDQTQANGWISFSVEPLTPGAISVTATCQNAVPHQGEITVSSSGPYAPLPFDLISPIGGDTVWTTQPLLIWAKARDIDTGDVVTYDLYWSHFVPGLGLVRDSVTNISDTAYTLSGLSDNQIYFWKVKAKDTYGLVRWSNEESSFGTYLPEPPQSFGLISPSDPDTAWDNVSSFFWHKSKDLDPGDIISYTLFYSTDSLFVQKDSVRGIPDTTHTVSGLMDDQNYYWRVKAKDRFDLSIWSIEVFSFHTYHPDAPSAFSLLSPSNGAVLYNRDTLTLVWESAQDPDPGDQVRYVLQYGISQEFVPDSTRIVDSLISNSYTLDSLLAGETHRHYYWRVKAFDKFGLFTWSNQTYNFEIYAYVTGDASGDKVVDVADVVFIINYLYKSGASPIPLAAGDANCDGEVNVGDVTYLINYLYRGGSEPCYP